MKKQKNKTKRRKPKKTKRCGECSKKITRYEFYKNNGYCNDCNWYRE